MANINLTLPSVSQEPFVDANGYVNPAWARFFWNLYIKLGGQGVTNISGDLEHTGSKVGLYNETPVVQASKINDPAGGVTIDTEARAAINAIIDALEGIGITSDT